MVFIITGVAIVSALALWVLTRRSAPASALGWMSERWLAENRASRHE